MGLLDGRVALISGGAGGIGVAIARNIVAEGGSVMLGDLKEASTAVLAELGAKGQFVTLDATRPDSWNFAAAETVRHFGGIDMLINACGSAVTGKFDELDLESFRRSFAINVDSILLGTQSAMPYLAKSGRGAVINFSSTMGVRPRPELPAYCASKAAVLALSRSLALDCAERKNGVRVNTIIPGAIRTEMSVSVMRDLVTMGTVGSLDEAEAMYAAFHPLARIGEPEEIAHAVVFLCSDHASFITGAAIPVDGGYIAG